MAAKAVHREHLTVDDVSKGSPPVNAQPARKTPNSKKTKVRRDLLSTATYYASVIKEPLSKELLTAQQREWNDAECARILDVVGSEQVAELEDGITLSDAANELPSVADNGFQLELFLNLPTYVRPYTWKYRDELESKERVEYLNGFAIGAEIAWFEAHQQGQSYGEWRALELVEKLVAQGASVQEIVARLRSRVLPDGEVDVELTNSHKRSIRWDLLDQALVSAGWARFSDMELAEPGMRVHHSMSR